MTAAKDRLFASFSAFDEETAPSARTMTPVCHTEAGDSCMGIIFFLRLVRAHAWE